MRGGPVAEIIAGLTQLIAVTRRPSSMDEDKARLYFEGIAKAMMDYPIDVVTQAFAAWRRGENGEWWPAEAEIRRKCDQLVFSRRALRNEAKRVLIELIDAQERASKPSHFADEAGQKFRNEMRKRIPPEKFDAFFHPFETKFFPGEILVRFAAQESYMTREGRDLLNALRLTVRHDPAAFWGERERPPEHHTEAERAVMAKRLIEETAKAKAIADARPKAWAMSPKQKRESYGVRAKQTETAAETPR